MDKAEFISAVAAAGVVGAGGAGFPAAVKLNSSPEWILVNGAECEPLLKVDQQLAEAEADRLARALEVLTAALGAKGGVFAIKEKYGRAVEALRRATAARPTLSVKTLGNYYPMGDEQVLVYEVLGRIVPEGGLPLACGTVVVNVESLLNMAAALEGRPVTETWLTVTGEVKRPATYKVPLGVSISEIIEASGGALVPDPTVINGGPMMGRLEEDLSSPVTKATKGLIVLDRRHPRAEAKRRRLSDMLRTAKAACCHCMFCTELCPRNLLGHRLHPDRLMRLASYGQVGDGPETAFGAFLCCECGLCEQACVMGLQPWRLNRELKGQLGPAAAKSFQKRTPTAVNRFRELRRFPIPRLVQRLGLSAYEGLKAPLTPYPGRVERVRLALKQHLGVPCRPLAAPGDVVALGQLVAAPPEGALGAPVHASLAGVVESVDEKFVVVAARPFPATPPAAQGGRRQA
ncbi:MAG: SLBB domain-containing protein [Deltaproteobacteria bacterium]|jgi:Na+-translocating ferredoxin:NAD+ oxidoreductase RnfC subunit|nr:SLBB domain-containing protein [Deltaproteobacteria bacterium]